MKPTIEWEYLQLGPLNIVINSRLAHVNFNSQCFQPWKTLKTPKNWWFVCRCFFLFLSQAFPGSMWNSPPVPWSTTWGLTMTTSVSLWRQRWQIHTTCQRFVSRFGREIGGIFGDVFVVGGKSICRKTWMRDTKKRLKFFFRTLRLTSGIWTWTHYEPRQLYGNSKVPPEKKVTNEKVTVINFTVTLLGLEDRV